LTEYSDLKHRIAILASGGGSNASNLIRHFEDSAHVEIVLLGCNKPGAGAFQVAADAGIPSVPITRNDFYETGTFLQLLLDAQIDWIILAGFLWKLPNNLVSSYSGKIINIHPSLLPKYGGKGMYGHFVHEAVHAAKENESGITIHFVDEHYDEGKIIFQARVEIFPTDSPADIEHNVRELEQIYFAQVVDDVLSVDILSQSKKG